MAQYLAATLPVDAAVHEHNNNSNMMSTGNNTNVIFELKHALNPELTRAFDPSQYVTIGRDANACNIVFPAESAMLSRVHCKVYSLGRDVLVQDWSSNGTFINGRQLGKGCTKRIQSGDTLSVVHPHLPDSKKYSWVFFSSCELEDQQKKGDDANKNSSNNAGNNNNFGIGGGKNNNNSNASSIHKHYELRDVLGTGNFATVRLGISRAASHQHVAVKIVEKKRFAMGGSDFSFQALLNESEILRSMSHPNIVRVFDVFDEADAFTMVLELVRGGDLFDYIVGRGTNPFSEADAKVLFVQLVEALLYMHSRDIVHRDLKPENILVAVNPEFYASLPPDQSAQANAPRIPVDKVTLKITDFGLAKFCKEHEVMTTMCGTPTYLAPEVLHASTSGNGGGGATRRESSGYTNAVDVWSLGVILYILLSGTQPKGAHQGVQFSKYFNQTSAHALDLVTQMLIVDPKKRADLEAIVNHPWLAGMKIDGREHAKRKALSEDQLKPTMTVTGSALFAAGTGGGNAMMSSLDMMFSTNQPQQQQQQLKPLFDAAVPSPSAPAPQQQQQQQPPAVSPTTAAAQQQQQQQTSKKKKVNIPGKPKDVNGAETDHDDSDSDEHAGDRRDRDEGEPQQQHKGQAQQAQQHSFDKPAPPPPSSPASTVAGAVPPQQQQPRTRIQWMWKSDLDKPDSDRSSWREFKPSDSAYIEHAFQKKSQRTCKVPSVDDLRVSFEGMFQFRAKDTGRQRAVKRVEITEYDTVVSNH